MNEVLKVLVAIFLFLVCVVVGAAGGCFLGAVLPLPDPDPYAPLVRAMIVAVVGGIIGAIVGGVGVVRVFNRRTRGPRDE